MKHLFILFVGMVLSWCTQQNTQLLSSTSNSNNQTGLVMSSWKKDSGITYNHDDNLTTELSWKTEVLILDKKDFLTITWITDIDDWFLIAFPQWSTEILSKDWYYYGKDKNKKQRSITYNISNRKCTDVVEWSEDIWFRKTVFIWWKQWRYISDPLNPRWIPWNDYEDWYMSSFCFEKNNKYVYVVVMSLISNHSSVVQDIIQNSIIDINNKQPEVFVNSWVWFSIKLPTKWDDKSKNILTIQWEWFDWRDRSNKMTHNFIIAQVRKKIDTPCWKIVQQWDWYKNFTTKIKHWIEFTLSDVRFSLSGEEWSDDYLWSICFEKWEYIISVLVNEPVKSFYLVREEVIDNIRLF